MEGEIKNLVKVWLSVLASLCYCYLITSKIARGKLRLCSLLPIVFLFGILPLHLSYLFPIGIVSLFITWLANFKLLLFAFDQGPLSSHQPNSSLPYFILTACLPIRIRQNKNYPSLKTPELSPSKPPKLRLNWPTKVLIFALFVNLHDYKDRFHPKIVFLAYSCMVYLLIDILFGICNSVVRAVSGMELEPPSNEPYFATSLQDFWGRRWNLMVTNLLRQSVYKPVRSMVEPGLGPNWAPVPAVVATFLVSGLMHDLVFYYVTRVSPTWEVTCFFMLHGICLVVEVGVKKTLGRWRLHWAVSAPLTVALVVGTAMWLFFPPLERVGAMERAIGECKAFLDYVKGFV